MTILTQLLAKGDILLTDGAMGTYYAQKGGICQRVEYANLKQPSLIEEIHREYLQAGASLIRTNTFAANTASLGCDLAQIEEIITAAYSIAKRAAEGYEAAVAADIGPIPNTDSLEEYYKIADIWLKIGADTFVMETFTHPEALIRLAAYIKNRLPHSHIHASYALTDTGYTKSSYYAGALLALGNNDLNIDSMGFNCGVGPMHLGKILKGLNISGLKKPVFAMPNAGYPELINGRICYVLNPEYFAATLADCTGYGVKALGGCCGTTPKHIALLREQLKRTAPQKQEQKKAAAGEEHITLTESRFGKKLKEGRFVVAVELDPPFKPNCDKLIKGARLLKDSGVDIVTIADSPMGKSRVDSVITSLKVKRETGLDVLPHICCRDKNAVSLRSVLLGAYMEDIRDVLVVTGDPVPGEYRSDIKSVFNMNSYTLIDMIAQMNESVFDRGKICIGGAVNLNVKNKEAELERLLKKQEKGAEFFLTQPIFDQETIDFLKRLPRDRSYKILAGIMPPVSYKNVSFLNNELAGVTIPPHTVRRFTPDMSREEAQAVGEAIAREIINELKPYVDGLYIIAPFNRCEMISSILKSTL